MWINIGHHFNAHTDVVDAAIYKGPEQPPPSRTPRLTDRLNKLSL